MIRRFKQFCQEQKVIHYSSEIGKAYADDVIIKKTGKFSKNRYYTQGRFYRLIDSYYSTGTFDFSLMKKGRIVPNNEIHQKIYTEYKAYLLETYENENTRHFYEYGMYCLLQFLNNKNITVVLCQEKVQVKHELFTSIFGLMPHLFPCVLILSNISFHTH